MHGRIKVKTTAEQEEERRKEQERKLKVFRKASALAFQKITSKEYDGTGLEVTGEILSRNSDFSSLWNYRKRAVLSMKEQPDGDLEKFCDNELDFLATCLRNNPKSYGCWHHRCFIMLNIPTPDWNKELKLCNQFLQFDDRNFHCWDYRRFVVKNSVPKVGIDDEIKVTEHLIENNFSNYSSWHYRSKLLPKQFPSLKSCDHIEEKKWLEELEYVQNAFFTDPNDQSAWFYNQWLVGHGEQQQKLLASHFDEKSGTLACIFKKPTSKSTVESCVQACFRDEPAKGTWRSLGTDFVKYCHGWVFEVADGISKSRMSIILKCFNEELEMDISNESTEFNKLFCSENEFHEVISESKLLLLKSELGSCIELNDLEPGNKWVILTLVQLMNIIDPEGYKEDINKYVSELQDIDPPRKRYYSDLKSKIFIEQALSSGSFKQRTLNLSNMGITRMCDLQYFSCIKILNVSNNSLVSLPGSLFLLRCCEQLLADENRISDVSGVTSMPKLILLSLKSNCLTDIDQLKNLSSCPDLKTVNVEMNSFGCVSTDMKKLLPGVDVSL